jgi:hypothetical protein
MAYCGPKGIPLSQFLQWSETDQDEALAWQAWEHRRCPECGTHPEDWDERVGGSRYAYHAEVATCQGCVEKQRTEDGPQVKDHAGHPKRGVHIRLAYGAHGDCPRCRPQVTGRG